MKKFIPALLFLSLGAYFFFYAYGNRNVASFLWGVGFFLVTINLLSPYFKNTLVIFITIIFTLALVENILAFLPQLQAKKASGPSAYFDASQTYNTPGYSHLGQFGSQPQFGSYTAKKMASAQETIYDVVFTIGQDGFRVTPRYDLPSNLVMQNISNKNFKRFNFLGDSFTFGEGVQDNQTMPYYFGELGNATFGPLYVKNYGIHGWGMQQALAILQSQIDTKADLQFALTAPWHASRSACADPFSLGSPKYKLLANGLVERDGYCRSFAWVEHSPKALRALITSSKIFNLIQDSLLVTNDQDKQIRLYLGIMKTMQENLKQKSQKLIVGFIKADENWFVGNYNNEKIMAALKSSGIDVIDMTLAAKNEDLPHKYYLHELDKHPTAAANIERVKILIDNLIK